MPERLVFGVLINQDWASRLEVQQEQHDAGMYALAAEHLGACIYFFQRKDVNPRKRRIRGWVPLAEEGGWAYQGVPWPSVYYDQAKVPPAQSSRRLRRLRQILRNTSIPLNPVLSLPKWQCHVALARYKDTADLLPDTMLCRNSDDIVTMLSRHAIILAKPDGGSRGRGITRVWSNADFTFNIHHSEAESARYHLNLREVYKRCTRYAKGKLLVLQQEIPLAEAGAHERSDMRITVGKNMQGEWEVTQSYLRVGRPGRFVTNWHQGANSFDLSEGLGLVGVRSGLVEQTIAKTNNSALLVARRLEQSLGRMGELGIDMALDRSGRIWMLEANATPDKGSRPSDTWHPVPRIFLCVLEYAQYLWKHRKSTLNRR